jgi:hypothetical protein
VVRGVRHLGIPVVVAPFSKVDDTRRHREPSQVAEAHLRLDLCLSTVTFSS